MSIEQIKSDLTLPFSFINIISESIGSTNNINRAGNHRISKTAPAKAKVYTFTTCPSHQYPDTMILRIKTILSVLGFLNEFKFSFIDFKLICDCGFAHNVLQLQEVGDFADEICLPPLNLIYSSKLLVTTEPPISCKCYYSASFIQSEFCLSVSHKLI